MKVHMKPWTWGVGLVVALGGVIITMQNCAPQEPVNRRFNAASTGSITCELVPPSKSVFRQGETINFSSQFEGLESVRYRAALYRVATPRNEQIGTGKSFTAGDSFVRMNFAGFAETTAVGAKSYVAKLFDAEGVPVCETDPVEINIDGTTGGGSTTTVALNAPTYAPGGQTTEVVITPQTSFPGLAFVDNPSSPNVRVTIGGAIGCPTNIRITREAPTEVRGTFNNLTQSISGCSLEVRYQTSNGVVVGTVASPAIPGGSSSGGASLTSLTAQVPYSSRATVSAIIMSGSFPGLAMAPTIRFSPSGCPSNIAIENFSPTQVIATFPHLTTAQQCTVDLSYTVSGQTRAVQGSVMIGAVAGVSISNVRQETPGTTTGLSIDGNFPAVPTTGSGLTVNFASGVGVGCPTAAGTFVSATTSLVRVTIPNLTANATGCRLRLSYPGVYGGEYPNVNLTAAGSQVPQPSVNQSGIVLDRADGNERHYTYMTLWGQYPELPQATSNFKTAITLVSGTNCPTSIETTYEKGGTGEGQINARYVNVRKEAVNCRFRLQYTVGSARSTEFTIDRIPAIPSLFSSTVDGSCSNATLVGHNLAPADTEIVFYTDNGANWELVTENGQTVSVTLQGSQYTASLSGQSNSFYNGKEGARFPIPNAAKQKLMQSDRGLRFTPSIRGGGGPLPAPPHDQPTWDVGERLLCTP